MRSSSVRTSLAILTAAIILMLIALAAEVMLDFPFVIGFGQSRLLPSGTLGRLNCGTAAFLLVVLFLVALPIRNDPQPRKSVVRWLWSLPRTRLVRAFAAIPLMFGWIAILRYWVSLDVATYQVHASAARLEEVVEARTFFDAVSKKDTGDRTLLWGECSFRNLEAPCIIEAGKEDQSVIHFRRENEAAAIVALKTAGLIIEKQ